MSASDQSGGAQLAKEIGDLYLNENFSDVTIVVNGVKLPAHRLILSQRCLYFKNLMIESTSKRIELRDTPIDSFKLVLKWIYTGEIEFTQKETAEEVQRLSNMFLLTELKTVSMKCVEEFNASFKMPISDQSGVAKLAEEIGKLCLKRDFSDVTVVVNGTELPAHRMILSQRCTYLENMLEKTPNPVELRKTPINGFRSVLKWIYTGETEFTQMDNALEVLRLSNKYKLVELEKLAGEYVEANFNVGNVCDILNSLTSWSANGSLIKDFLSKSGDAVLVHATFSHLHKDSMKVMLEELPYDLTNVEILQAFVRWMNANRDKSKHFPDLLKLISLNSIDFDELASVVPNELISANVVIEVAHEQRSMYENGKKDTNFATAKYGAKVTIDNENVFMSNRYLDESTVETTEVVIDLRQHVKLNLFSASRNDNYTELSPIDISVSTDGATWTRVVHQRILENPPFNDFNFDERVVRFIRISGQLPLKKVLELDDFQAYYE